MLETDDYEGVKIIKGFSEKTCEGRRYAVLEGGYDHRVLGGEAFIEGVRVTSWSRGGLMLAR